MRIHVGVALLAVLAACGGRDRGPGGNTAGADASTPPPAVFQPGFHEALRWSLSTSGVATYRYKIPIGRAGKRIKLVLRSGSGPAQIFRASIGRFAADGAVAQAPVPVTFAGAPGISISAAEKLVESDPVDFTVGFHEELYVSFEATGELAASAINLFPGSFVTGGNHAADVAISTAVPQYRMAGLATVYVEAEPTQAFVVIGDSITEGYIEGGGQRTDDYRNSWPYAAETQLQVPVVNAAVAGQGTWSELQTLDQEVLALQGITDCGIMLGTNDLGAGAPMIEQNLSKLYADLHSFCKVTVTTLPPKDLAITWPDRQVVNGWLMSMPANIDLLVNLDAALGVPPDYNTWLTGLSIDGIHPTISGNAMIAQQFVATVRPQQAQAGSGAK